MVHHTLVIEHFISDKFAEQEDYLLFFSFCRNSDDYKETIIPAGKTHEVSVELGTIVFLDIIE